FEGSDIDDLAAVAVAVLGSRKPTLVGLGSTVVVAPVDGGAVGQQRMSHGRAAVVLQRAEPRVDGVGAVAHLVVLAAGEAGAAAVVAEEVVAIAGEIAGDVRAAAARRDEVPGDDRVRDAGRAAPVKEDAAAFAGVVLGDSGVG